MNAKRDKRGALLTESDLPRTCDFLSSEILKYLQDNCNIAYFDDNMDVKRQIDEIAEINDVSIISEFKELFTTIAEAYGEGTPSAVIASMCLEAIKEFELQYVLPEDVQKERKREGRGLFGDDSTIKKKKIEMLVAKYAKRVLTEERCNEIDAYKRERDNLIQQKNLLEDEITRLQEELKDSIEKVILERAEPTDESKEFKEPPLIKKTKIKKNKKDSEKINFKLSTETPSLRESEENVFKEKDQTEMRTIIEKLTQMPPDQLEKIKNIVEPGGEEVVKFNLTPLSDDKFRLVKDAVMNF
uniref:Uncharacterized protein n=1 Tax=Entamoeba invadens TaxID=33085 RepID=S0B5L2_ENTIV|nr:hypothetical protein [Entamoeba invadens]